MALVGGELSPTMAMQHVVGGGERDLAPERVFERGLDRRDHQNAAGLGTLQKGCQELSLSLNAEALPVATATNRAAAIIQHTTIDESIAQSRGPFRGHSDGCCRLGQI